MTRLSDLFRPAPTTVIVRDETGAILFQHTSEPLPLHVRLAFELKWAIAAPYRLARRVWAWRTL